MYDTCVAVACFFFLSMKTVRFAVNYFLLRIFFLGHYCQSTGSKCHVSYLLLKMAFNFQVFFFAFLMEKKLKIDKMDRN